LLAPCGALAQAPTPDAIEQGDGASDTALSARELAELAQGLGAQSAAARERALSSLTGLGEDALPAISARLTQLSTRGFDAAATLEAMSSLRSHAPQTSCQTDCPQEAPLDLLKGVLPGLREKRSPALLLASELVALLRALEAQQSAEAADVIVGKLFALDAKLFRYEAPRTRSRLGPLIIPAAIRFRNHPRSWVRKFSLETLAELHVSEPGRAVQQDDVALLAAILQAYGDTLWFEAMPVVVSYVGDERSEVRAAARRALARFGKNAIWQLRERYLNTTGKEANPSWSHQRLLGELARWFETPQREAVERELARANTAIASGDFATAEAALDAALVTAPFGDAAPQLAPLYVRIAGHHEANGRVEHALDCLRRALRLDADGKDRTRTLARIKYLEAELRLATGQVDLISYTQALALDPGLSEARAVLDELTGKTRERERERQRALALLAAAVLVVAGCLALRGRRPPAAAIEPVSDEAPEPS
jgi:tetratricopeptide (TPR) repeat protein